MGPQIKRKKDKKTAHTHTHTPKRHNQGTVFTAVSIHPCFFLTSILPTEIWKYNQIWMKAMKKAKITKRNHLKFVEWPVTFLKASHEHRCLVPSLVPCFSYWTAWTGAHRRPAHPRKENTMMNDKKPYSAGDDVVLELSHPSTKACAPLSPSPTAGLFVFPFRASVNPCGVQ